MSIPALNDSKYIGMSVYNVVRESLCVLHCQFLTTFTCAFVVLPSSLSPLLDSLDLG